MKRDTYRSYNGIEQRCEKFHTQFATDPSAFVDQSPRVTATLDGNQRLETRVNR